jgi:hypothetical protein
MPIPPTFIPLQTALRIASDHLNIDQNKALAMLVDGMCDSTVTAWGGMKGEVPHQLSPNFWIMFKYSGAEIGCDFIEVETLPFLIWLGIVPANWRDLTSADWAAASEIGMKPRSSANQSQPAHGQKLPIPKPTLVKYLETIKAKGGRIPAADLLFREVVNAFPGFHVTRFDVRAVAKEVWGEQPRGRRRKSAS